MEIWEEMQLFHDHPIKKEEEEKEENRVINYHNIRKE